MSKWRIIAKEADGTMLRAIFYSPHTDVFKALEDFNRRNPGWQIKSISMVQPRKSKQKPQVR